MLSDRQMKILNWIVEEYVKTAEPVGSKTLSSLPEFQYSSATIRNDMAVLEEQGYLLKTHTSSGRIPSVKGYKLYVSGVLNNKEETKEFPMIDEIFKEIREMQINSVKKYTNELNILEGEEIINVIPKKNYDYCVIIHKFELVGGYINDDVLNEFHDHLCKEGIYLGIKSGKILMIHSIRENPEIYDQLLKINPEDFVKLNFIPTFIGDMYDSLVNDEEENEENKDEYEFEKAMQSIKESMLNDLF